MPLLINSFICSQNITITFDSLVFNLRNATLAGLNVTYQRCCATCNESSGRWPPTLEPYEILAPDTNQSLYYDYPTCDDKAVKFKMPSVIQTDSGEKVFTASVSLASDGTSNQMPCT